MSIPRAAPLILFGLFCLATGRALAAPVVVVSIAPLHSLAAAVMADVGEPHLLLRGGESPHTFSLRPSDARRLHDADVVFWIGPVLELPLSRILSGIPSTRQVAMFTQPGVKRLPARDIHRHDDGAAAHAADAAPAADPHIWLSPANAVAMTTAIERSLAAVDPGNATRYHDNAARLRERLRRLDDELHNRLAGIEGSFLVFHDAYQYLERRYGLRSAGAITTGPERRPGAAHLSELHDRIAADDVRCLFSEPQYSPRLIAALDGAGELRHAVLDPLGADLAPGPDAYERMMRTIGDHLDACMRGGPLP